MTTCRFMLQTQLINIIQQFSYKFKFSIPKNQKSCNFMQFHNSYIFPLFVITVFFFLFPSFRILVYRVHINFKSENGVLLINSLYDGLFNFVETTFSNLFLTRQFNRSAPWLLRIIYTGCPTKHDS